MSTAVIRATAGEPNRTRDPKGGFASFSEMLGAMLRLRQTGGRAYDERLKPLAAEGSDEHGEYSDPHGGFLVPTGLLNLVLRVPPEADPMAALTRLTPSFPNSCIPARVDKNHTTTVTGGLRITRIPETVEQVSQRGELEQIVLEAFDAIGLVFTSDRLANGAAPMLEEWLARAYADAWIDASRTERIRGSGVGEGLGVLLSPALITIAKEAGQANDTVVAANVQKMSARCWGYDEGAVWIASPELRSQIQALTIPVGAGGVVALYEFAKSDGEHDRLAGRPIFYDEHASAPGDVGDIICCRWSEYIDAVYRPIALATSMHVRMIAGETAWRAWVRNNSAPWWRSALTPRFGTATLSPYVTLAAR